MSDTQPQVTAQPTTENVQQGLPTTELHQQGKSATLDDVLAELRGKRLETPEVKTADTAETKDPVPPADFNTGNKALDVAVSSFVRSTGATDADIQRACKLALEHGDPSMIDRAFLDERFKDRAEEAAAIAGAVVEQAGIERDRLVQSVYATAGGEEQWKAALSLYKQHAPQGLQKAIQMMFDSGDAGNVKDAASLVAEFAKTSGVVTTAGGRQVAGAGGQDAQGLSQGEFQAAMNKLNQSSRTYGQDYDRLIQMRRIGKNLGK
jgi:hypothetical protein